MAEARAALERLCRHYGIATEYDDIWGTRHGVPDANLTALLAAFDVDATSGPALAAADRAADQAHWHLRSNLTIRISRGAVSGLDPTIKELQASALFVKVQEHHSRCLQGRAA